MSDTTTYRCPYCRTESAGAGGSCPTCGAPVDITAAHDDLGLDRGPAHRRHGPDPDGPFVVPDRGHSSCPPPRSPSRPATPCTSRTPRCCGRSRRSTSSAMPLRKAWTRMRAGPAPRDAAGGRARAASPSPTTPPASCSRCPLQPGAAVDVREHQMVAATGALAYDWIDSGIWFVTSGGNRQDQAAGTKLLKMGLDIAGVAGGDGGDRGGNETEWHYPLGQYLDRFTATERPGRRAGPGRAATRSSATSAAGESILVKPPVAALQGPLASGCSCTSSSPTPA